MTERMWWQGAGSLLNDDAMDFVLAAHGLKKAYSRLGDADDPHCAIECSWWISAAAEACGRNDDNSILGAFYWVRNKGFHNITNAFSRIDPPRPPATFVTAVFDRSRYDDPVGAPATWIPLETDLDNDRRAMFNNFLAGQTVRETIQEAHGLILDEFARIRNAAGDLP